MYNHTWGQNQLTNDLLLKKLKRKLLNWENQMLLMMLLSISRYFHTHHQGIIYVNHNFCFIRECLRKLISAEVQWREIKVRTRNQVKLPISISKTKNPHQVHQLCISQIGRGRFQQTMSDQATSILLLHQLISTRLHQDWLLKEKK